MSHVTHLIQAYIDGELHADEAARVEAHTADCDACRRELEAMRNVWGMVDAMPSPRPTTSVWPDLAAELDRRRRPTIWTWPQRGLAATALAAGVAVGLGLGGQRMETESTTTLAARDDSDGLDYLQDGLPTLDQLWIDAGAGDEDAGS